MVEPEPLMRLAIERATAGIAADQTPFGCAVARGDQLLAAEHNTVFAACDITAHAEINALRAACAATGSVLLCGTVAATTCEPCPMCLAALHWARVETVYYGATIADAAQAGFNELKLPAEEIIAGSGSPLKLVGGILADECRTLFDTWKRRAGRRTY